MHSPLGLTLLLVLYAASVSAGSLDGIYGIVNRRIPQHSNGFTFELTNGTGDAFVVSDTRGHSGGITVHLSLAINMEVAFISLIFSFSYVTEIGGVDIWWTGSRLHELPSPLPSVGAPLTGSSIVPYRYHFNTVTFGYTTAFWTFDKWSLLLDWLALRGVNLPLAWVGYEAILIETFREVGLTDADIRSFLSGPAFQPWNRFGNIQGAWGGELPMQWVNDQLALQKQIVARMVELGMTPILPSFTGFVPRAMTTLSPNASIVNGSQWSGFPSSLTNVTFLEPFDPLFPQIQKSFIAKQQAAYGNVSHFYTLDQYNENDPFSGNTSYLASITSNTFASLREADPEAIWVMQGWLFFNSLAFWTDERVEAFLGGVPEDDSMLILDLYSEAQPQWNRTNSYFGKSWVWCELHDFGGNMGMEGNLPAIITGPIASLNWPGSSMKGIGLSMEGQELGNEIVYDIVLDQAWSPSALNISGYVEKWVSRRYPVKSLPPAAQKAWSLLSTTVYNNQNPNTQATIKSIFEKAPALTGLANITGHHTTIISYDTNSTVLTALKLLVQASDQNRALKDIPEFVFDMVEFSRQLLANRFLDTYGALVETYNSPVSTPNQVSSLGDVLLDLLQDVETLLATNENYLLSTWISDARQWDHGNASYGSYLEYNARNQLTLWGPTGEINDYASKQWSGLVGGYYQTRWQSFLSYLVGIKTTGEAYNATLIAQDMLAIGEAWDRRTWGTRQGETSGTKGDTFEVVTSILSRWA
ncbi:hypothetical protein PHLCEN_2v13062 [Hermanssonia centrifuga]|uniref:Alpha-N-acetylglucosaminidase n=1 Tax=Hermanssonia centrifuga TaxID=98765 RepID=A0A2R6NFE4_9APHY|nr:hypothetical protein PHLCEN_2v13062 [Hermanssonia centrifuga]